MTDEARDLDANRLAREALAAGRPTGWFEPLYRAAAGGQAVVPWDRDEPNALLAEWADGRGLRGEGRRAIVVGCGFGADAEYVAWLGFETAAFDIAETAVEGAQERYPTSRVRYEAADLLWPPRGWLSAFDLVVEVITVQALPQELREQAIANVAGLVAPGGTLIVVSGAREPGEEVDGPPWPLTRAEVDAFGAADDMRAVAVERIGERWRAEFTRVG
jgi:SAM-dependent methyltransferase